MAHRQSTAPTEQITDILKVSTGQFECCIVGTSPIVLNRMSQKVLHELLMPAGRKTTLQKATSLKHDPVAEYRAAPYVLKDPDAPTLLAHLATAFKGAMRTAALDMPGASKAQIGRLTYVEGEYVGIYGLPQLFMMPVRSADMNHTPDIRTRAIVAEWACSLRVTFVQPLIKAQSVANLLAGAGLYVGVGDGRPEKGKLSYGQFRLADRADPDYLRILKTGGRAAQQAAMDHPVCYDDESTELLAWYTDERARRILEGRLQHETHAGPTRGHQSVGKRARTDSAAADRGSRESESTPAPRVV